MTDDVSTNEYKRMMGNMGQLIGQTSQSNQEIKNVGRRWEKVKFD